MPLAVVGVSHHTAPVEIRERVAFGATEGAEALLELREASGVEEAVLLSTCNRTEVYLFPARGEASLRAVEGLLARKAGQDPAAMERYFFRQFGDPVVEHLFQVSSGLDSLVIGEAEIQGQVRDAYERSTTLSVHPPMAGPVLNRLFQMALSVGGRVRAETSIGEGSASVASVSVELARKIFGQLKGKQVLVLGAGATGELIVEALGREGVQGVTVANRTYNRAVELARRLHGQAAPFDRLSSALASADIVLSSTSAPHPLVTPALFREAFPKGRERPLLMIDVAVPRDVDPSLSDEREVFLYNVDDLRTIVDEKLRTRAQAMPEAEVLIREQADEFRAWYASLEVVPVIREMRSQAEGHRANELERLFRGLDHLPGDDRARVEEFSRRLLNKLLHEPTARLRQGLERGGGTALVDAVRFLYGLEDHDDTNAPRGGGSATDDEEDEEWG